MKRMTITVAEYLEARDAYQGMCIACGGWADECEPDACEYTCDECGADAVYGVEELLIQGLVDIV